MLFRAKKHRLVRDPRIVRLQGEGPAIIAPEIGSEGAVAVAPKGRHPAASGGGADYLQPGARGQRRAGLRRRHRKGPGPGGGGRDRFFR